MKFLLSSGIDFGRIEQVDSTLVGERDDVLGHVIRYLRSKGDPRAKAQLRDPKTAFPQISEK